MRSLKYLAFILAFLVFQKSFAQQTYYVTSNADSGPGTLRQGLTNAAIAGRTEPFIINFQLPGIGSDHANRTIRLKSALPAVSSNVVIDGSSQASWVSLGVSGAKIILEPESSSATFSGLTIGKYSLTGEQTTGVEIYGLYIRNFANITNLQTVNTNQGSGIIIDYRADNITIGAPNKGNVIGGNINGISIQNSSSFTIVNPIKMKIQSNLIGLIYDGTTPNTNVTGISANLYDCALDIGGDNAGEGNIIAANRINIDITRSFTTSNRFDINVIGNKIGVDATGLKDFSTLPIFLSSSAIEIYGLRVNAVNSALYVRNNVIGGNRTTGITIAYADFILTGNAIGTDNAGNVAMGNGIGVKIETTASGTIGGATDAEKNLIANNNFGIETTSTRPVKITRNSMFCNKAVGIGKTLTNFQPFVQILKKRADYVAGRATANSEIELFYTANCQGICEGKTYIATVQAGSDGRWEYNGMLSGNVSATASLLNATTSPFSTAQLLANEAVIAHVSCASNGSITVPETREGFTFSWVKIESNGTRTPKGNTQSITNLDVGTYELTIDDGCKPFSSIFEIKDQILVKPTISSPAPMCGQTSFTLTAGVAKGYGTMRYEWYNAANPNVMVSSSNPVALPEGTYFVRVKDAANCSFDSDPLQIIRKPQPRIKVLALSTPATCGLENGSITKLELEDVTGTARYEWYMHDVLTGIIGTTIIGTDIDLKDQPNGRYSLKVYDDGNCPVTFGPYLIDIVNNISISVVTPVPARCGEDNGSIPNPTITNANFYQWRFPDGTIKEGPYSTGMSIALNNLAAGTYTLTAKNTLNGTCVKTQNFIVNAVPPKVFAYATLINRTSCGIPNNGSIELSFTGTDKPIKYEWRDEQGNIFPATSSVLAGTTKLKDLRSGSYYLTVWDINNCQIPTYGPFTVETIPILSIVPNSGTVVNDKCTLKRGSITGVQPVGGLPAYKFTWIDENDVPVGNKQDLIDMPAGTYRLKVEDQTTCGLEISQPYTITNEPLEIQAPNVADIRVCYVSDISIPIIGAEEGTYQLYTDIASSQPIMETNKGVFNFKVSKTADYFIRRKIGSCLSDFTKVHVEVTHDNLELGNVITPNGDGLNDYWMVKGLPDYKGNNIKIYTRGGQLVYESVGNYNKPFDGTFRDKQLPAGVYFYVIDLRAECKPISGSITLLR